MDYNAMGNDYTNNFDTQDINDNKVFAVLAYIPILFWLPLVAANGSKFGRFHANQGLLLLILDVALSIATSILSAILVWIPIVGAIVISLLGIVTGVVGIGLMIYGMVNTGSGKAKELPIVGGMLHIIK